MRVAEAVDVAVAVAVALHVRVAEAVAISVPSTTLAHDECPTPCVQVIGEEVEIVHKSTVPEQERFPPPQEKYLGHQGREWQGQGCV